MYSCIVEGQVLDFKYKKLTEHVQAFYIGHIYVGQVFKMRYDGLRLAQHQIHMVRPSASSLDIMQATTY